MIMSCYILIAVKVWKRNAPGVQTNGRLVIYRAKMKVLKMLAVIVILFAFSWLPLYAIYLRMYYGQVGDKEKDIIFTIVLPIAQWLGASNCCMNPIIYCFFSKKYRRGFRKLLRCGVLKRLGFSRTSRRTTHSQLSTRYIHVDNSSGNHCDLKHNHNGNRVSSNKYMVVAFSNGKMTVSFRKENVSDESSFWDPGNRMTVVAWYLALMPQTTSIGTRLLWCLFVLLNMDCIKEASWIEKEFRFLTSLLFHNREDEFIQLKCY